jgi:hypothetical protein
MTTQTTNLPLRMIADAIELPHYAFKEKWLKEEQPVGDHRVSLSIKAEFHGKTYEIKDAWWNYNGWDGLDSRVVEFFEHMWSDGYGRYLDDVYEAQEEQRKAKQEKDEREQLEKLKQKYG